MMGFLSDLIKVSPELNSTLIACIIAILGWLTSVFRKKLNSIEFQVKNNHGSSMKDSVNRTETKTDITNDILKEIQRDIGGMREDIRRLSQIDDSDRVRSDRQHDQLWDAINQRNSK